MITDEDLADAALHVMEPEQRFRFVEQLARKRLETERDENGGAFYDNHDYMSIVLPAAQTWGIAELNEYTLPSRANDSCIWICANFRSDATRISNRILFEQLSRPARDPNTVALSLKTKEILRFHLQQVRTIIDSEPIDDSKKQELFDAIAKLEREIDKSRTRIASVIEVAGKVFSGEIKAFEAMQLVVTIVYEAIAAEKKQPQLPAPTEQKQLEGPKATAPKSELVVKRPKPKRDCDDEIPF